MMKRLAVVVSCLVLLYAPPADAQIAIDAGAGIGIGCVRGETACADTATFFVPHIGVRIRDRVTLRVRFVDMGLDDLRDVVGGIAVIREDRSRQLMLVDGVYGFRPGKRERRFSACRLGVA